MSRTKNPNAVPMGQRKLLQCMTLHVWAMVCVAMLMGVAAVGSPVPAEEGDGDAPRKTSRLGADGGGKNVGRGQHESRGSATPFDTILPVGSDEVSNLSATVTASGKDTIERGNVSALDMEKTWTRDTIGGCVRSGTFLGEFSADEYQDSGYYSRFAGKMCPPEPGEGSDGDGGESESESDTPDLTWSFYGRQGALVKVVSLQDRMDSGEMFIKGPEEEKMRNLHVDLNGTPESAEFELVGAYTVWEADGERLPNVEPREYEWSVNPDTAQREPVREGENKGREWTFNPSSDPHETVLISCKVYANDLVANGEVLAHDDEDVNVKWFDQSQSRGAKLTTFKVGVRMWRGLRTRPSNEFILWEDSDEDRLVEIKLETWRRSELLSKATGENNTRFTDEKSRILGRHNVHWQTIVDVGKGSPLADLPTKGSVQYVGQLVSAGTMQRVAPNTLVTGTSKFTNEVLLRFGLRALSGGLGNKVISKIVDSVEDFLDGSPPGATAAFFYLTYVEDPNAEPDVNEAQADLRKKTITHYPTRPRQRLERIPMFLPSHSRVLDEQCVGATVVGLSRFELSTVAFTPRDSFVSRAGFTTPNRSLSDDVDDRPLQPQLGMMVRNVAYQLVSCNGEVGDSND